MCGRRLGWLTAAATDAAQAGPAGGRGGDNQVSVMVLVSDVNF